MRACVCVCVCVCACVHVCGAVLHNIITYHLYEASQTEAYKCILFVASVWI